jgi:hypothetical protein
MLRGAGAVCAPAGRSATRQPSARPRVVASSSIRSWSVSDRPRQLGGESGNWEDDLVFDKRPSVVLTLVGGLADRSAGRPTRRLAGNRSARP